MAYRIEIASKRGVHDGRGAGVAAKARNFFHLPVTACATRDVFKVDVALTPRQLREVQKVITDPVIARSAQGRLAAPAFDWLVETGFKPGVTDNLGRTAQEVVTDAIGRPLAAHEGVVAADLAACTQVAQELHEVESETVIIVDQQDHGFIVCGAALGVKWGGSKERRCGAPGVHARGG